MSNERKGGEHKAQGIAGGARLWHGPIPRGDEKSRVRNIIWLSVLTKPASSKLTTARLNSNLVPAFPK